LFYDIKDKIGEGAFGTVQKAVCRISNQLRAIKRVKKKKMSKENKKSFIAEM
jgi:serine/threonine protein kinase